MTGAGAPVAGAGGRGTRRSRGARSRAPMCLPETALHEAWRRADGVRARVASSDGLRYRVLYSGMPGGSYGPDFRQAVLERADGSELVGDVEIHVRGRDWYAHGHATDPRYCGVVMHGVWSLDDPAGEVFNASGIRVPLLGLGGGSGGSGAGDSDGGSAALGVFGGSDAAGDFDAAGCGSAPGAGFAAGDAEAVRRLPAAGEEWFAQRVARHAAEIDRFGGDLAVQLGVFEALGYPRNRAQFRALAQRVPWHYLRLELAAGGGESAETARARAARLLGWGAGLEARPEFARAPALAGEAPAWNPSAGLPANRPARRLPGAAALAVSWHGAGGPLRQLLDAVRGARRPADLWRIAAPAGSGIGRARAMEITVNALLPIAAAWARRGGDGELLARAAGLFDAHPALGGNSALREAARWLGLAGGGSSGGGLRLGGAGGAKRQQGALHLYRAMLLRPRWTRQPALR